MGKRFKKNKEISKKEHDQWHRKNDNCKDYDGKIDKEHELCHKEIGLIVEKK